MIPTPDPWEQLLPAALVGTARRAVPDTPDLPAPEAEDAPGSTALLDRAALAAVRRAAGHTPHTAEPVEPAPEDDAPEVGAAASRRLAEILTTRAALLPEWLDLVARAGRRVPAAHLPTLLDRGARDSELRPAVAAAVGARGHWLARFRDTWHYLGAHGAATHFDPRIWEHGAPPERRRVLAALRRTDPAAARERTAEVLRTEPVAERRRSLLSVLASGLTTEDEDVLAAALDDRAAGVRGLALSLLSRLPDSDHADRLRAYVRALVSTGPRGEVRIRGVGPGRSGLLRDLALAVPERADDTGAARSERLWALITHAPLDVWTALVAPDPARVLARVERSRRTDVHDALVNAAGFQGSAEWARALLSTLGPDVGGHLARATQDRRVLQLPALLRPLPLDERCAWVHRALNRTGDLADAGYLLRAAGGPWTPELSVAATRMLLNHRSDGGYRALCEAAAEYLPPEHLDHLPPDPPGLAPEDRRLYLDTRDTVLFRREMQREL
ncbi:DUF5691 domain-containing protein [Nocardiopsis xinjiangensis]|uniref:DUF5691 domain-containing protein n=1 Tax=Nocardiopsis xinjiangensis TaxID=124285 RepID=UPI00034B2BDE|nr:DUF5691 domain-containing protein [Nocardiopsis xinjiangensis]